eukprot:15231437-Heterocapsa_arctica.AAC.1
MKDIMKLAEETWEGLWAVEAEELPKLSHQKMPLITEDEVRRVVNNLADGKANGVDGWSSAELRALSRTHSKGLTDILNKVENIRDGRMASTLSLPLLPRKELRTKDNSDPSPSCLTFIE